MIPKRCDNCGRKLAKENEIKCAVCRRSVDQQRAQGNARIEQAERKVVAAEREIELTEEVAERKLKFLTALLQNGGHVQHACKDAGVAESTMRGYADEDPDFHTAWLVVQDTNIERLESEADRRALGFQEELTYQGRKTGESITRYSDNLLMFRLKALRPEKYRDGPNVSARTGAQLTEQELNDALTKMMARRKSIKVDQVSEEVS